MPAKRSTRLGGVVVYRHPVLLSFPSLQLAAHDRSVLEKMFLGSVSDYCVTHSKRPVLLLHPHHSVLQ